MKRITALILALMIFATLAACGSGSSGSTSESVSVPKTLNTESV